MPTKPRDARQCHPVRFAVGPAGFIRIGSPIGCAVRGIPLDSERRAMERGVKVLRNCIIVPPRVSPLITFCCAKLKAPLARHHALDVHE
jgi:hypothetical protein